MKEYINMKKQYVKPTMETAENNELLSFAKKFVAIAETRGDAYYTKEITNALYQVFTQRSCVNEDDLCR